MNQTNSAICVKRLALDVLIACLAAIGATEVTGINRVEQTLIHRNFGGYQVVFFCLLWAFSVIFVRLRMSTGASLVPFLAFGLCAGLLSGWLTFPLVALLVRHPMRDFFSVQGVVDFIVVTTVTTFGWLVGLVSGALLFVLVGTQSSVRREK